MAEPGVIQLDQFIAHPPARVWAALTQPELLKAWWAAGDVEPVVGHRFWLDMGTFGEQECEVLAVEPERLFSYSFGVGMLDTTIMWRLEPENGGTRLSLQQSGFNMDSEMGKQAFFGMSGGWPRLLERIEPALDEAR